VAGEPHVAAGRKFFRRRRRACQSTPWRCHAIAQISKAAGWRAGLPSVVAGASRDGQRGNYVLAGGPSLLSSGAAPAGFGSRAGERGGDAEGMLLSRESRGGCGLVLLAGSTCGADWLRPLPPADAAAGIEAWPRIPCGRAGRGWRRGVAIGRALCAVPVPVRACGCACAGEVLAPCVGRVGG
jgi:hypothetical protein